MKLLFDLKATQPNISGKRHGGGRYGEIIFFRMIERNIVFSCFYDSKLWLNPMVEKACKENAIPLFDLQVEGTVKAIIEKRKFDRMYSCLPGDLAKLTCCEVFGTIHGMRLFETPYDSIFFQYRHSFLDDLKFLIKKIIKKQMIEKFHRTYLEYYNNLHFHLITVSEHSKYAFYSFIPELRENNIPVFYSPSTSTNVTPVKAECSEKYFLLVSGNRWEKNNLRAIIAFDRLADFKCMDGIRMKVTGTSGNDYRYKIKHPERYDFLGYVDDNKLESLYANAMLFVYPSLNEGFGYPPIEAMKYYVPVIASCYSSMAEVCGGGVLYFDPTSIEEIMNRMMMMVNDKSIYAEFAEKGYLQYQRINKRQTKDLDGIIDYITSE